MFEFISADEKQFVSTKLYDKMGFIEEIELACTSGTQPEGYEFACEADAFQSFIDAKVVEASQVSCDSDYPSGEHVYADTQHFYDKLLEDTGYTAEADKLNSFYAVE